MSLHYNRPYGRPEFQAYIQNSNVRSNICGSLPHMQYNNIGASYTRYGYPVNCMYPQDQKIDKSHESATCHRVQNQGHLNVDYRRGVPNIENVLRAQVQDYITMGLEKQVTEISITKESTKILKNWMKLHRNNPYPSKTEKVMLAYSTRMTMTQISNWFANARRRIKQQKSSEISNDSVLELSNGKKSAQILNSSANSPQILGSSAKSSKILDSSANSPQILDSSANLHQIPYSSENISQLLNSSTNSSQITERHNDTFLDHDMTGGSLQNSLNEPHITPDSGLESFTELDDSTQRVDGIKNENKELKCKTNLFGTDPVSDITVEPLEDSAKKVSEVKDQNMVHYRYLIF